MSSTDCGSDEPGAASLLARHKDTVGEINAYQDDITALAAQADKLQKAGITSLSVSGAPTPLAWGGGGSNLCLLRSRQDRLRVVA